MSSTISTSFTILLLLGLVSFLFAASIKQEEPPDVQCRNDKECPDDHCCVINGGRYVIPQCRPLLKKTETCKGDDRLFNTTLYYPNDKKLTISGVHFVLCPCHEGLICGLKEKVCISNN
ncbi:PREDICTED: astakine-like [Polistes canadensis]|uniref:astakine-like n=1 Tax=Polistes canadensis TaxID=91411 RepID=UPI000718DAB1|nr:PREDICTED: astakine-like [Polistes canadensis]